MVRLSENFKFWIFLNYVDKSAKALMGPGSYKIGTKKPRRAHTMQLEHSS